MKKEATFWEKLFTSSLILKAGYSIIICTYKVREQTLLFQESYFFGVFFLTTVYYTITCMYKVEFQSPFPVHHWKRPCWFFLTNQSESVRHIWFISPLCVMHNEITNYTWNYWVTNNKYFGKQVQPILI